MPKPWKFANRTARVRLTLALVSGLLAGLAAAGGRAGSDPRPPSADRVERLIDDAADGELSEFGLVEASLLAEGLSDLPRRTAYLDRFQEWTRQLIHEDQPHAPPRQRAAGVLHFLHREVLCGPYDPDATELSGVFESGTFNCVSSAVLFQALCQQISLETWPILAAGHVSHVVPSGGRPWLVETTAVQWADILASGDGRADLSGRESVDGVAPRRPLRPAQLLSVIYYNQAVRQLAAGLYAQSLDANLAAWRVDPENPDVRRNLLVTINNWAVALAGAGHYADAAALLASGRRIDPGYDKFRHNEAFLQDRWWRQRQDRHPQSATCPPPATVSEIRAWNWFRISEFPAPRG